jgi:hypothetical protein
MLPAKTGIRQFGFQLAEFQLGFRLQWFGKSGSGHLQHFRDRIGFFHCALDLGIAPGVRRFQFGQPFNGPGIPGGHML